MCASLCVPPLPPPPPSLAGCRLPRLPHVVPRARPCPRRRQRLRSPLRPLQAGGGHGGGARRRGWRGARGGAAGAGLHHARQPMGGLEPRGVLPGALRMHARMASRCMLGPLKRPSWTPLPILPGPAPNMPVADDVVSSSGCSWCTERSCREPHAAACLPARLSICLQAMMPMRMPMHTAVSDADRQALAAQRTARKQVRLRTTAHHRRRRTHAALCSERRGQRCNAPPSYAARAPPSWHIIIIWRAAIYLLLEP